MSKTETMLLIMLGAAAVYMITRPRVPIASSSANPLGGKGSGQSDDIFSSVLGSLGRLAGSVISQATQKTT